MVKYEYSEAVVLPSWAQERGRVQLSNAVFVKLRSSHPGSFESIKQLRRLFGMGFDMT